jgi:dCMP deaminase
MSFLEIAEVIAKRSKDPSTKVGAIIVDSENRIVSTGYNGFVSKNNETFMTFERPLKYHLTIHAEMNALLFAKQDLTGKIMYITHSPCSECLKHILQCRIRNVFYSSLYSKFVDSEKEAIGRLILSTGAKIINFATKADYLTDLGIDIDVIIETEKIAQF